MWEQVRMHRRVVAARDGFTSRLMGLMRGVLVSDDETMAPASGVDWQWAVSPLSWSEVPLRRGFRYYRCLQLL